VAFIKISAHKSVQKVIKSAVDTNTSTKIQQYFFQKCLITSKLRVRKNPFNQKSMFKTWKDMEILVILMTTNKCNRWQIQTRQQECFREVSKYSDYMEKPR